MTILNHIRHHVRTKIRYGRGQCHHPVESYDVIPTSPFCPRHFKSWEIGTWTRPPFDDRSSRGGPRGTNGLLSPSLIQWYPRICASAPRSPAKCTNVDAQMGQFPYCTPCFDSSVAGTNFGHCARYRERRFDDLGDDGRVEWMTVEIFHLQGPGMLSSHVLSQKLILKYTVIGHIGPNLMPFHFLLPVLHRMLSKNVNGQRTLKGSRELGQNRLVQLGVTISDGIYTANSSHLDCKVLIRLQENCEVPNDALITFLHI